MTWFRNEYISDEGHTQAEAIGYISLCIIATQSNGCLRHVSLSNGQRWTGSVDQRFVSSWIINS